MSGIPLTGEQTFSRQGHTWRPLFRGSGSLIPGISSTQRWRAIGVAAATDDQGRHFHTRQLLETFSVLAFWLQAGYPVTLICSSKPEKQQGPLGHEYRQPLLKLQGREFARIVG